MRRLKSILTILLASIFVFSASYAEDGCSNAESDAAQCSDAKTAGSASLPQEAQAEVDELKVKMRYFKAIGFHSQSGEARDKIAAIYEQYGVPLPDEFKK